MARFYIGQRCRLKYSRYSASPVWRPGAEVVVRDFATVSPQGRRADYRVECSDGSRGWPQADQLEPILPSGAAPSELTYTELMDRCRAGEGCAA